MDIKKKLLAVIAVFLLVMSGATISGLNLSTVKADTDSGDENSPLITLDQTDVTLPTKSTFTLTASVFNTEEGAVIWSSDDTSVASVNEHGEVTVNRYGSTTIHAVLSTNTSIEATCSIHGLFYDVAGSDTKGDENYQYYYSPVYWAADNGITTGYDKVYFGVGENCTRASVMIFIWRQMGCPSASGDARTYFTDLTNYSKATATNRAIAWAYEQGITKGYSNGTFGVNDSITRKDVLIMLFRAAGKPAVKGTATMKFTDCSAYKAGTDTYYAILWGYSYGITSGYSDGTFRPLDSCLREQIITFIYRYNNTADTMVSPTPTPKPTNTPTPKPTKTPTPKPTKTPTPKPTKTPTPKPTKTPTPKPSTTYVYITDNGAKYHSSSECSNMKNPIKVTLQQAIASGRTACSKCVTK